MRILLAAACAWLIACAAFAAETDPDAPKGRLGDAARPTAYRLDMTIVPDQPRFSGHVEIDVEVKAPTRRLYMHGRGLKMTRAFAAFGGAGEEAAWSQVDPTGVARLDFATPLPAGKVTLKFDYDAAFGDSPSSLYHIKVGEQWYSWTQFESIDARGAFPSFDEPGFKTPFTITIATTPGLKTISNAPETGVVRRGALEAHQFAPTRPLPTYLVAMDTGPFLHPTGAVPPDAQRAQPLPLGAAATQAQAGKLDYVMTETPRIVELLESYFGQPFPFPKLDQIATPEMPGAMENAGADTYADGIIVLDAGATTRQRQTFGMVVAHELSHQWFGDLVSPAWWDDIWLNESFANWMGFRIGSQWRPELNIGVGALTDGLAAMNTDALEAGRPIHQHIATNGEIDSAFDSITYGKGGQVIAMIAAYMGDDQFKAGVRLHLSRHMYGNADTDQFFSALADAAHDPRILAAMRSFVDQPGVPLVTFARRGEGWVASQSRYAFLGSTPLAEHWSIPLCVHAARERQCMLLDHDSAPITLGKSAFVMPNAGGAGYYRFELPSDAWRELIAALPSLPAGEALAADDSLWASFRAGRAPAASLISEMASILANPDSNASVIAGQRMAALRRVGVIEGPAVADYHRLMARLYAPKLAAVGFDPAAGAHAKDAPDLQKQRQDLVGLVAFEAGDAAVKARLAAAAKAYLAGDAKALDHSFLRSGLAAYLLAGDLTTAQALVDRALASEDSLFRGAALSAVAATGRADVAVWLLGLKDARLRPLERLNLIGGLASTAETKDMAADWLLANYDQLANGGAGIFISSRVPGNFGSQCSAAAAARIDRELGPKIAALGVGVLDFQRTVEVIRHCADLKAARQGELAQALKTAG